MLKVTAMNDTDSLGLGSISIKECEMKNSPLIHKSDEKPKMQPLPERQIEHRILDSENGHSVNRDSENGHSVIQDSENGHSVIQNSENGHSVIQDSENGHSVIQDSENGHSVIQNSDNGHSVIQDSENGHNAIQESSFEINSILECVDVKNKNGNSPLIITMQSNQKIYENCHSLILEPSLQASKEHAEKEDSPVPYPSVQTSEKQSESKDFSIMGSYGQVTKIQYESKDSPNLDLNVQASDRQYDSKDSPIMYPCLQTSIKQSESKDSCILGPYVLVTKRQYESKDTSILCSSVQTSEEQSENKDSSNLGPYVQVTEKQYESKDSANPDSSVQVSERQYESKDTSILCSSVQTSEEQSENTDSFVLDPNVQYSVQQFENVDSPISNTSVPQTQQNCNSNNSSLLVPSTNILQDHSGIIQSDQISKVKNVEAPMLTHILSKTTGSHTKSEQDLVFLDSMKRIEKWFDKLDELNQYNSQRFRALLEKIVDFKRLESLVKEKYVMLSFGKDLSLLEIQSQEGSIFEMSTYKSLYAHCEHILRLLTFYERYLNAAYERHNKLRTLYLDCSIQMTTYPVESKLFEDRKRTLNTINHSSVLMNKISLKLEETDNFTSNLSFECLPIVKNFLRDCEITFGQ